MPKLRSPLWILALVLTALFVALAGAGVVRKVETFQPLGFTARPAGAGWVVETVEAPGSGLRPGDQIFQIEGRDAADPAAQLRSRPETELLITRGAEVIQLTYVRPPLRVDYPYLIFIVIGVVYLLIGLFTLYRHHGRPGVLFYLWCMASAALYLLSPVLPVRETLDKVVYVAEAAARIWLPALTLHLFLVFPERLEPGSRLRRLLPFVYLPAAIFTALQADIIFADGRLLVGGRLAASVALLDHLELIHFVAFGVAAVAVLVARLLRHGEWQQRRQVQWIAFGLAAGYLPFAALYLLPWLLGLGPPQLVQAIAVLPLALVPLAFAWAILRYKLWDIGVIVRETLSSTVTLILGIVAFSLVHLALSRGLPEHLVLARNLLTFLAGLAIAGLLLPTRQGLAAGLERLQYRSTFLKRRALVDLAEELLQERDLHKLCERLAEQLEASVPLSRVNLYLARGTALAPLRLEPGLPQKIHFDELGDRIWLEDVRPISATALPAAQLAAAQRLFLAGYRYLFPLRVMKQRVGLVLCSYKPDDNPLNSDDLELIRQILDQAALAIENAQLLDQLRQRLDEVAQLQRYNEGIIASSPAGIAVLDAEDRIVSANAAFAALASPREGADPSLAPHPTRLVGRPFEEVLPVKPLPGVQDGLWEVSYRDSLGAERYLQLSVSAFHRDGASPLRILVAHDVTERVAMENALKESDRLAALGMLAAGVAHEVNTPITGISSYAQMLLAETPESDPRHELLKKVERQTFRAARIVNNLLEFARNEGSEQRPLDVIPLIGETLDLLKERFQERHIRVRWQPPEQPLVVRGNGGELQQVLTNLFVNSCDAMSEGGGTLEITVDEDDTRARILVSDTGVGIPPERLQTIFQPFFSTKLSSGGTGLGLSISFEIVRRHGGDLRAESWPGKGSRLIVELPKAKDAARDDPARVTA